MRYNSIINQRSQICYKYTFFVPKKKMYETRLLYSGFNECFNFKYGREFSIFRGIEELIPLESEWKWNKESGHSLNLTVCLVYRSITCSLGSSHVPSMEAYALRSRFIYLAMF